MKLLQKIKNGTGLWPCDSTSGMYLKKPETLNEFKLPCVHWSIIYNRQDLEVAQVSSSGWVYKTTIGHLHNGILLGCKKEESLTFGKGMDGPGEHYAKWNKPVRERQIPYGFTHMQNFMNKINQWTT